MQVALQEVLKKQTISNYISKKKRKAIPGVLWAQQERYT